MTMEVLLTTPEMGTYYLEQKYGNSIVVEWFMQKNFVEKPQDYIRYLV